MTKEFEGTIREEELFKRATAAQERLDYFDRMSEEDDEKYHSETMVIDMVKQLLEAGHASIVHEELMHQWLKNIEEWLDRENICKEGV